MHQPSCAELFISLGFVAFGPSVVKVDSVQSSFIRFVNGFVLVCAVVQRFDLLLFSRRFERVHSVGPRPGRARTALYSLSTRLINVAAASDFPRAIWTTAGLGRAERRSPVKHLTARTD